MKKKLFLSLGVILIISFLVPLFIGEQVFQYLSSFAVILTTFLAILTAIIAILLYDRFSVEKDLLSKQLENVAKLIDNIRFGGLLISVRELDAREESVYYTSFEDTSIESILNSNEALLDYKLVLGKGAHKKLISILDGLSSVYIPNEIYAACRRLLLSEGGPLQDFRTVKIIEILPLLGSIKEDNTVFEIYGQTFRSFLQSLNTLYETIENWLEDHNITTVDVRRINWLDPLLVQNRHYTYSQNPVKRDMKDLPARTSPFMIYRINDNDIENKWSQSDIKG